MAPKQKRKKELELISYDELLGSSSMTGLVSFLDIHPGRSKKDASLPPSAEVLAQPSVAPEVTPSGVASPHDVSEPVQTEDPEMVNRSLPDSSLQTAGSLLPDSNLPPVSNVPSASNLLTGVRTEKVRVMAKREPDGLQRISSLLSDSDLRSLVEAEVHRTQPRPDSNLLPASDLLETPEHPTEHSQPAITPSSGSNLLSGGDLRTANGRTVRLRLARSVQDAHTNGEHMLLTAMWKKASPETDETRLLKAGLAELSRWTGSHKTSCRAYLRALVAKLALEEAETFDSAAGSEGARVYRIFSFNTILERRRRANLTHVIRTGAVSFVDPKTGEKIIPDSNLLSDSNLRPDSNLQPDSKVQPEPGSNHPPTPGSNQRHINNKREESNKQTTTTVYEAFSQYGMVDDAALRQLIRACQEQAPDCSNEEIAYFIHEKGQLTRGKGTRIQNRIGFLIDAVPKCFAGDAIRLYRELRMEGDEEGQEERDRAWGREHQAELNDPNVPEEIKRVIRRCLGTNDGA